MDTIAERYSWSELSPARRAEVLLRPAVAASPETLRDVRAILEQVRTEGDTALLKLTQKLDGATLDSLAVQPDEFRAARETLTETELNALRTAIKHVRTYHEAQLVEPYSVTTAEGVVCERITRPVPAVGLYVPAGTAPLPSTAIMLAVPAELAQCPTRVLCTPPRPDGTADPAVLVAAEECGIEVVFKLGGAQAVAALAYGTESIPKVDKIFGPGNAWVTAAKTEVAADPAGAALDMPAGPSEVMVIADASADPRAVALDLLSQAEHGVDSQVILVTDSPALADATDAEISAALPELPRRDIMAQSLAHSRTILVTDISEAFDVANDYAPEHLIVQVDEARQWLEHIMNAGSIFLGPFSQRLWETIAAAQTMCCLPTVMHARTAACRSQIFKSVCRCRS